MNLTNHPPPPPTSLANPWTSSLPARDTQNLKTKEGSEKETLHEKSKDIYFKYICIQVITYHTYISKELLLKDPSAPHGVQLLIEDYPYASNGLEIWDAIKSWVEEYVSFYYKSAEELQKDPELQAWWKELVEMGHGDFKDKPWWQKMQTREELVEAFATLIWIASALHAAVNFGQYPYGETLIDLTVIEILSRHASDEFYLGQRDGEAFKRFGKNLEEIEKKLIEKNNDETLRNRYGPAKMP
uniref:Lipoxygenase domain-containing protein n=1 Tax=Glycine max TaxID=3847 RepID=A0A0R0G523_SOYBN